VSDSKASGSTFERRTEADLCEEDALARRTSFCLERDKQLFIRPSDLCASVDTVACVVEIERRRHLGRDKVEVGVEGH